MPVTLTIDRQPRRFETDSVTVGSAPDNVLAFPGDARLAARHAVLKQVNGRWLVEVLEGCPVRISDGRPVRFAWLNPGDVLYLSESGPAVEFQPTATTVESKTVGTAPAQAVPPVPAAESPKTPAVPGRSPAAMNQAAPVSVSAAVQGGTIGPPSSSGFARMNRQLWLTTGGVAAVLVLAGIGWAFWPLSPSGTQPYLEMAGNRSVEETGTSAPAELAAVQSIADPQECLVVIGVGDLKHDNRPHILGVGWLWDERTTVVPRLLGDTLKELLPAAAKEGAPVQACVIQGVPLEVATISEPAGSTDISLLHLKQPAELESPTRQRWHTVSAADIERLRSRGKKVQYLSYEAFPRSGKLKGQHQFSLQAYDPELVRLSQTPARLLYEQRRHHLQSDDDARRPERGGILLDQDQKIIGMALSDSSILWTDALESALGTP